MTRPARHTAQGRGAAAAAEDPRVLDAIATVLEKGGNAVDAAVAGAAAQGVCRPMSGGLGGGGFMVITLPTGRTVVIEHREQASAAFGPDSFIEDGRPLPDGERRVHGESVGVPGAARAWDEALKVYGRLDLAEVLAPAIELADRGFEVDETLQREIHVRRNDFAMFEPTCDLYLTPEKEAIPVGHVLRNPDLARTYEKLAADGMDGFYHGWVADAIVAAVNEPPEASGNTRTIRRGRLAQGDFLHYQARHLEPLRYRFGEYELAGAPLPSSGAFSIAEALAILDRQRKITPNDDMAEHLHRYLTACRLAFADREAYLGDNRLVDVPVAALLSDEYLQARASQTGLPGGHAAEPGDVRRGAPPWVAWEPESPSTIHLTVTDGEGCTVSYTSTIVSMGGCGIVVPGTGILLNDALAGRAIDRGGKFGAGRPMGGMRPLSSMAPTMVFRDGRLVQTVGSPGGTTIITTVLQILYLTLGAGMSLHDALAYPRVTQRNRADGKAEAEPEFLALDVAGALRERGHSFDTWRPVEGIGAANGLQWHEDGSVTAVAEPMRRGGGHATVWDR
ncbi:gamma-glutamyltransferase [Aeromicrobium phragmitis]|uniref:Gamma-glutamyltransferase n=1 Tax=Aeromicrobium phragmitis TaxID=2478914 RepID=A0A3L8PLL3_9ACTN|nr:gamma-glutamyltransferase [Aeromicrobium phragmitis]RLV56225.1 gamma-glutamyltransferase [Aeromicrobium phragmitis]